MVHNILMRCEVCESPILFKWQIGHIERAPVSLVCPECKTILKFVLITDQKNITIDLESKNVIPSVKGDEPKYFAETSSELLTVKVSENVIPFGYTPFIRTTQMLGEKRFDRYMEHVSTGMYYYRYNLHKYHRLNDLYYNSNKKYFTIELLKNLHSSDNEIELDEIDIIEKLYQYNISFYDKFAKKESIATINKEILRLFDHIRNNHNDEYERFLVEYCKKDLLIEYDKRIYKSLNSILDNYPYLMPSIVLSYFSSVKRTEISNKLTITTTNFEDVKNIYIAVYENIMQVYEVLALLNNIIDRGNYEKFDSSVLINNKPINSINQFKKLGKGHRLLFLDKQTHFDCLMPEFDRKIRNAIGHELWDYEPFENRIIFEHDEMYLLEFVFSCWKLFESIIGVYIVMQDLKRHQQQLMNNFS